MIHHIKQWLSCRLALLAVMLFQTVLNVSADKVYIEDFSIKAGESKLIAVNFDTEATDISQLNGYITLPGGLIVEDQGTNLWMTPNTARNAIVANYRATTREATIQALGGIYAGTGAVAYIKVQATADLPSTSTIVISDFKGMKTDNSQLPLETGNAIVTREAGEGEGGSEGTPTEENLAFSFNPAALNMYNGQSKQVEVLMENGMTPTGLEANLTASAGLTITNVAKGNRISGWNYNAMIGKVVTFGPISGNEGTVFTVTLKADEGFSGSATLTVSNINVTNSSAKNFAHEDIVLPITVDPKPNVTLSFSTNKVFMNPGETSTVDVNMESEADLTGFQAMLTLPENVTATLAKGDILASSPAYNPASKMIIYLGGITARQGKLFTLTLTASDEFAADDVVTLTDIQTTTSESVNISAADISLQMALKTEASVVAPTAKTLTYNGEEQELVNAGSTADGVLQYSLDGVTYATAVPKATDAGGYTVYYKVVADANHNDLAPQTIAVTIDKASLSALTLTETNLTYNGTEQTVTALAVKAGELDVPSSEYTLTGSATNVGNYTATVTANDGSKNFKGSASASFSIVAEDAATFTIELAPTTFVYDGTAKQPTVTVKDGTTVLTEGTDYTVAYTNNINATETATVTVTGKGNYSGTKSATFAITKAQVTDMTLSATSLTYNGEAQTVTVTSVKAGELPVTEYTVGGTTTATDAGTYTVTVTANGSNFEGTAEASFTISPADGNTLNMTLGTSTYSYDGTEKQPTVTVKDGDRTLAEGTDYTVAYENNVDAGNATVTVTFQGNYTGTKQQTFIITPAQLTEATLSQTTLTYNGEEQTVEVSSVKAGSVEVPATDYTVSGNKQTNAGTYTVTVTANGSNYQGSATATFTIGKADATVASAPEAKTGLTYNGQIQTLVSAGVANGGELMYSLDGVTFSNVIPSATDAGTYTVYYKVVADANHNDVATATVEATIAQAQLTAMTLDNTTLNYNGEMQTVNVTSVTAGTLDVPATDYTVSGNTQTNVGTYTVTVTANDGTNFAGSLTATFSIVAEDAATFTIELTPTSFVYDGTEKEPVITVKDGTTVLSKDADYTVSFSNNVNAGTATVTVTGIGNYSGTKTATFTIEKADVAVINAPAAITGLVYDETAQTLANAGAVTGGTIVYSTDGVNFDEALPTGTNAGTYTVYYKVKGDANHNDGGISSFSVTIAQAGLTDVTLNKTTLTYNKTEQVVNVVSVKAGTLDVPATAYTVDGNAGTDAGTYTVTVTASTTGNFTGMATANFTITAANASVFTITLSPESFIYDGTEKQPTVAVKDGEAVLTEGTDYTVAYENNVNAGTAKAVVTGQGNYTGTKE